MINKAIRTLALAGLFFSSSLLAAPLPFQASYSVMKSGISLGKMKANLIYSGNQYTYLKQTKANGLAALLSGDKLTERSEGQKNGGQLIATAYLHHHKNNRKDRRDQFSFANQTQVQGSYKDQPYSLNVPRGTIDPALLELRIMDDMAANKPLNYRITEKGKLKEYRFQKQGREVLSLPAGKYDCEKIQMSRDNGKRVTTIWLAKELNYVPVKIRFNDEGDIIETQLQSYQKR